MRSILICSLALLTGCASTKVNVLPLGDQPARQQSSQVEVFLSKTDVNRAHKPIAIISVDDQGWEMDDQDLLSEMRARASRLGADAVYLVSQDEKSAGGALISGMYVQSSRKILRGTAVIYTDR